ncbi:MAG: hotdog fold thioesterase [Betaproteobacteria bacterium]|nr:hotdog fold thioesterase [Betaproteobacteria bacterium]
MSEAASEKLSAAEVQALFDASPFIGFLGLQVVSVDHDAAEIQVRMPLRPELERRRGTKQFHGGPIASFVDTVGDFAIGMAVGGGVPTMNLRIDYLRPAVGDSLLGTGRVRRAGKTAAVIDVDVSDEQGRLVAIGRGTYSSQRG